MENRIAGSIYGQFIGDALGTRYEFMKSTNVINQINEDIKNNFLPILGGGPFNLIAGQVTDDTELGCGLMMSLIENKYYNQNDVAIKYLEWYNSCPFDCGNTIRGAFNNAHSLTDILYNVKTFNTKSRSNGCLMRIFALGIYATKLDLNMIKMYCSQETALTHYDDVVYEATLALVITISELIKHGNKDEAIKKTLEVLTNQIVLNHILDGISADKCIKPDGEKMGYLGVALHLAYYELMYGNTFYNSMIRIIGYGGDTDTNACITGTILGAYYGISAIPIQWINTIKMCKNPRIQKYKYIDQQKIDENINKLFTIICN